MSRVGSTPISFRRCSFDQSFLPQLVTQNALICSFMPSTWTVPSCADGRTAAILRRQAHNVAVLMLRCQHRSTIFIPASCCFKKAHNLFLAEIVLSSVRPPVLAVFGRRETLPRLGMWAGQRSPAFYKTDSRLQSSGLLTCLQIVQSISEKRDG